MTAGSLPAPAGLPGTRPAVRVAAIVLCLAGLGGCAGSADHDAWLALGDLTAGTASSRLRESTPEPSREPLAFVVEGRKRSGDLYLPGAGKPRAAIVLVPGAVPEGKDNEQLVAFAAMLARLEFAVLTPEMSGYRDLRIGPQHVREVADAFRYLSEREEWSPGGRAGIGAFSYAAGPALLAALEDDIGDRVRFVLAVGGYHDLRAATCFLATGYFEDNGVQRRLEPGEYGKLVFIRSAQEHVRNPKDRALLEAMVSARLRDPTADLSTLAAGLGPEGRSIYRVLTNTDPARCDRLLAELPEPILATMASLTLSNKPLSLLHARLILVHGRDDPLIPYTESLALSAAAPQGQSQIFVFHRILGHVDLKFSHFFSRAFWSEELPDARRLLRALAALLREREAV
jgi:acetyl esterase/lipase